MKLSEGTPEADEEDGESRNVRQIFFNVLIIKQQ